MPDKPDTPPIPGAPGAPPAGAIGATPGGGAAGTVLPRRSPGHRGQDQRDTVAEMIQKAHEISLEAGSKMATVMKEVIFAAAGLAPFAAESARDLVNYMVRRGQMGAEEADRIRRDIEAAAEKRGMKMSAQKAPTKDEPRPSPFARPITSTTPPRPVTSAPAVSPTTPKKEVARKPAAPVAGSAAKKTAAPAKKAVPKKK